MDDTLADIAAHAISVIHKALERTKSPMEACMVIQTVVNIPVGLQRKVWNAHNTLAKIEGRIDDQNAINYGRDLAHRAGA